MSAFRRHVRWTLPAIAVLVLSVALPSAASGGKASTARVQDKTPAPAVGIASSDTATLVENLPTGGSQSHGTAVFPTNSEAAYKAAKAQAAGALAASNGAKGPSAPGGPLAPPTLRGRNFAGVNNSQCGCAPPDTHGVVGESHFLETSNSHIDIYQKGPGNPPPLVYSAPASTFWSTGHFPCDQRTIYDATFKRYIVIGISCDNTTTHNVLFIAASVTSNPVAGGFYVYNNINGPWAFCDYPELGQTQDAITITCDNFALGGSWQNSQFFGIAKARIFNGLGFGAPVFTVGNGTLTPSNAYSADQTNSAYYIAGGFHCGGCGTGGVIPTYRAQDLANPSQTSAFFLGNVSIPQYSIAGNAPCGNNGAANCIDTLDARFVNATTLVGNSLYAIHAPAVPTGSGFSGLGYYRIDLPSLTAPDYVRTFSSSTSYDFNPSLAATGDNNGNVYLTFTSVCNVTCANGGNQANPEVRVSGRQDGVDAGGPNTTNINMPGTLLRISPSQYQGGRWGDYSAVSADPQNYTAEGCGVGQRAWIVNEWDSSVNFWETHIARIGYC